MKAHNICPIITFAVSALGLTSCMFGPDYKRPDTDVPAAFRGAFATDASIADLPWWKVFKNKELQNLLSETYANNHDLCSMIANVEKARQYVTIANAPLFPWANYGANVSKGQNYNSGSIYNSGNMTTNPAAIQAGISWELDLWGKTRRSTEAAVAEYLASEEGQRALMLSLLSQVADGYLSLLQLDEQLSIMKDSVSSYTESYRLFKEQMQGEVGDVLQVSSAEAALSAAKAQIPLLESQIASLENTLSAIAGRVPGKISRSGDLVSIANAVKIPAGIPAQILNRRPDIRQKEQMLRAANARVGVAIANYFPSISLTAAAGTATSDLRNVAYRTRGNGWGITPSVTGPIFQGGTLRASEKAAKADYEAAKNDYEQTVLNALAEVSSTLVSRTKLNEVNIQQDNAVKAYLTSMNAAMDRYKTGLSDYFEVLYAQQNLFPAQVSRSQYRYQYASSLVKLYVALGGGWNMTNQQMMKGK